MTGAAMASLVLWAAWGVAVLAMLFTVAVRAEYMVQVRELTVEAHMLRRAYAERLAALRAGRLVEAGEEGGVEILDDDGNVIELSDLQGQGEAVEIGEVVGEEVVAKAA